jgi:hypothetical protein
MRFAANLEVFGKPDRDCLSNRTANMSSAARLRIGFEAEGKRVAALPDDRVFKVNEPR